MIPESVTEGHRPSGIRHLTLLTQYYPPEIGAAQVRLNAISEALIKRGIKVSVVTAMPSYPGRRVLPGFRRSVYRRSEVAPRLTVFRVWAIPAQGRGLRRVLGYLSFTFGSCFGLWRAGPSDTIFVESPPPLLILPALFFRLIWGAKIVLNVADLWPESVAELGIKLPTSIYRLLERFVVWAYSKADVVSAATEGLRSYIEDLKVATPVVLLANGVDTNRFCPAPPGSWNEDDSSGIRIFLYAGTHGYAHNLDVLLDAAKLVQHSSVRIDLVGDGSERSRLQGRVQAEGIANVRFHDPVSPGEVCRLLQGARGALVTVRGGELFRRTRSAKAFPAMATATPLIYSGEGEGAEIVRESRSGIVVAPDDVQGLAAAIDLLAEDDQLTQELGDNGREWVCNYGTWDGIIGAWLSQVSRENAADEQTA